MPWWANLKLLCLATVLVLLENHLIYPVHPKYHPFVSEDLDSPDLQANPLSMIPTKSDFLSHFEDFFSWIVICVVVRVEVQGLGITNLGLP